MNWDSDEPLIAPDWMVAEFARMTAIDDQVRAQLRDRHAADCAAAPDPSDVVRLMRENGALPELDVEWPESSS